MKQANSTEIDRLLQRHARRWNAAMSSAGRGDGGGGAGASQASDTPAGAHLDADEMSAYAEGALPAAAHARSVAHLADCETCRRMVTELVLAAEVAGEGREPVAARVPAPSKPWWSAITALFAPPVLRFAVPALLLLGIIVVAFVATRERREEDDLVARNEQKQAGGAASKPEAQEPSAQHAPGESATANSSTSANTNINQSGAMSNNTSPTGGLVTPTQKAPEAPPVTTTGTPTAPAGTLRDESNREGNLDNRVYDGLPKAAPPPNDETAAASKTVEKEKVGEEQQGRKQANEPAPVNRTETADLARNKDEDKANPSVSGGSELGQTASQQPGSRTAPARSRTAAKRADGAGADSKTDSGATETRSVGGRRFRRQGNAWVDTAYNSSRSTINVARGSDQYRALVADEPAIRNFADQLGGEVIVVWKGKAYRIY